jgi:hypothetical protein
VLVRDPKNPERLYVACGGEDAKFRPGLRLGWPPIFPQVIMTKGGFCESPDGGDSWRFLDEGLEGSRYLYSLAVDSGGSGALVASAALGPIQGHDIPFAESFLVRREGGGSWRRVTRGLPPSRGMTLSSLSAVSGRAGVFYAANNLGLFTSEDAGESFTAAAREWPEAYRKLHAGAFAVSAE